MFVDVHTHTHAHRNAVKSLFSSKYLDREFPDNQFFTSGVHPWFADVDLAQKFFNAIKKQPHANLIGIGECGLDRIKGSDFEIQKEVFALHLELAKKLDLPVVIHQVKATSDLMPFLKKYNSLTYVLHGFIGNKIQTKSLLDYNVYFSFGNILNQMSLKLQGALEIISADRIFMETDDKEDDISVYYKLMADFKNISVEDLVAQISVNFKKVFKRDFHELD